MTNNRKIVYSVFKTLKSEKLIPKDISFGNGYFIFSMGEDSVVHFHIKGIKGWLFAMWIDTESQDSAIQFFTQYEEFMDKFKPSRSTFCVNVSREELKQLSANPKNADWTYHEIIDMVKHIRYNPKLAFIQEGRYNNYLNAPMWQLYLKDRKYYYQHIYERARTFIKDDIFAQYVNKASAYIVKKWNTEIINDIKVKDNNTKDWSCHPRWDVEFYWNRITDNDDIQGKAMDALNNKINKYKLLFTKINTSFTDFLVNSNGEHERW